MDSTGATSITVASIIEFEIGNKGSGTISGSF